MLQRCYPALGAADRGARHVEPRGQLGAARDHELRRQVDAVHVAVDVRLEAVDHVGRDLRDAGLEPLGGLGGGGQLGAGHEQLVLEAQDVGVELAVALGRRARQARAPSAASSTEP